MENMEQEYDNMQVMRSSCTDWNDEMEMMASVQEKMRIAIWKLDQEREGLNREIHSLEAKIASLEELNVIQEAKIDILTRTIREEFKEDSRKLFEKNRASSRSIFSFPFIWSGTSNQPKRTAFVITVADVSAEERMDNVCLDNFGNGNSHEELTNDKENENCDFQESKCEFIDSATGHLLDHMLGFMSDSSDVGCNDDDKPTWNCQKTCSVEDFSAIPTEGVLDAVIDLTIDHDAEGDCDTSDSPMKSQLFWSLKGTRENNKGRIE
jgi:hypothetical protein